MSSDAQRKAASKYLATKKTITVRFDPAQADAASAAADAAGESLNAYIVGAVAQRMDREQPTGDALPPETEEMLK